MVEDKDPPGKLSSEAWAEIERHVRSFEEARRDGRPTDIQEYLPTDGPLRRALLVELVHTDLELRMEAGEDIRVETYFSRFPELASGTEALALIESEFTARRRYQSSPNPEEYRGRFPALATALTAWPGREPTLPTTVHAPPEGSSSPSFPKVGERIGDFDLLRELGQGAFARVFLARQVSLNRPVALKLSRNRSREAITQATLEHAHIVLIFGESIDPERELRLLAMRYVAGAALDTVHRSLSNEAFLKNGGPALLEAIARRSFGEEQADGSALSDCDFVETVCWIGARLAEALAHAHSQGVLHRDVKPANILLDRAGRPMLTDFNLAFDPRPGHADEEELFGGTPAYMAPEHLDAFEGRASRGAVDARSDIYSLGLVLFDFLTGKLPQDRERRTAAPSPRELNPAVPHVLDLAIRRALDPDPARRYQTATAFAQALEGCRQWQRSHRDLPAANWLTRAASARPRLWSGLLPLLPHALGAGIDLAYNYSWLAAHPEGEPYWLPFTWIALNYTVISLVLTGLTAWWLTAPLFQGMEPLRRGEVVPDEQVARLRQKSLGITAWALALSCLGWLPGAVLVPLLLSVLVAPIGWEMFLHLLLSFIVAGTIALTYNAYASLFLLVRVGYPERWADATGMWAVARRELAGTRGRFGWLQLLAGMAPLTAGAALLLNQLGTSPAPISTPSYRVFQMLLLGLIVLGIVGSALAARLHAYLARTITALTQEG